MVGWKIGLGPFFVIDLCSKLFINSLSTELSFERSTEAGGMSNTRSIQVPCVSINSRGINLE